MHWDDVKLRLKKKQFFWKLTEKICNFYRINKNQLNNVIKNLK